jgi:cation/acetate symporter
VIAAFLVSLVLALGLARLAAARNRADSGFHDTGGGITGFQNGLAMSGVSLSGASFLGVPALFMSAGDDGLVYLVGFLAGWPLFALLLAERFRNLGHFTPADIAAWRLQRPAMRGAMASGTLVVVLIYLAAQLAGVGQIVRLLFGLEYWMAVLIAGAAMLFYVRMGGRVTATWIEIANALLLLAGALVLALLTLWAFSGDPSSISSLSRGGPGAARARALPDDPLSMLSLGLAFLFGLAGLPHVLMRLFTVRSAREARHSASWAMLWNGAFSLLCAIFSFGVLAFLPQGNPESGEDKLATLHLAHLLGGDIVTGFAASAACLAVLGASAGLMRSGGAAVSHDLHAMILKRGRLAASDEFDVAQIACFFLGAAAILLGIAAEQLNLAVMVGMAFSVAASSTFPVLFLSLFWKNCTARGAAIGAYGGLGTAVALSLLAKPVWVDILGHEKAIFPHASPTLFSMGAAFALAWLFSVTDRSEEAGKERKAYTAQRIRAETGLGG